MPRRSLRSVKRSTTSRPTSNTGSTPRPKAGSLERLIDALPPDRLENVSHALLLGSRPSLVLRAARVPGRQRPRAGDRQELYERYPEFAEGQLAKIRLTSSRGPAARSSRVSSASETGWRKEGPPCAARRARPARTEPKRSGRPARGRARRPLPRAGLPADRACDRGGIRRPYRVRADDLRGPQDELQETLARSGEQCRVHGAMADGPPHNRTFTSGAVIDGVERGVGRGRRRKTPSRKRRSGARGAREVLRRRAACRTSGAADVAS